MKIKFNGVNVAKVGDVNVFVDPETERIAIVTGGMLEKNAEERILNAVRTRRESKQGTFKVVSKINGVMKSENVPNLLAAKALMHNMIAQAMIDSGCPKSVACDESVYEDFRAAVCYGTGTTSNYIAKCSVAPNDTRSFYVVEL